MLLALDPGTKAAGWAVFKSGCLVACGIVQRRPETPEDPVRHGNWIAEKILESVDLSSSDVEFGEGVYEHMQSYGDLHKQKGDQNDLITLALLTGGVMTRALAKGAPCSGVKPRDWKGNVPKEIMVGRVIGDEYQSGRLVTAEKEIVHASKVPASLRHNMIDAIGIGLWKVRRL